jgi:eukaryotic-like serine/threonine-protein kinase
MNSAGPSIHPAEPNGVIAAMTSTGASTAGATGFRRLAFAATAVAGVIFAVAAVTVARYGDRVPDLGWTGQVHGRTVVVRDVEPGGLAEGFLMAGDVVLAVDDDRRIDRLTAEHGRGFRGLLPPGLEYTLTIRRDGTERRVALTQGARADPARLHASQMLLLAAVVWCVVPALISLFRPGQPMAQLAYWTCMFSGMAFVAEARAHAMVWAGPLVQAALVLAYPFSPLHLAFAYDFCARFPNGSVGGAAWRHMRTLLYAVCAVIAIEGPLLDALLRILAPDRLPGVRAALAPVDRWGVWAESFVYPLAGLAILAVLARNFRAARPGDERRRMNWLLWATAIGLAPLTMVLLVISVSRVLELPLHPQAWVVPANLFTVVIPVALGYAIITHRVFGIGMVARKGLQYLLARNALRALLAVPVLGLGYGLVTNHHLPLSELLLSQRLYLYLLAATLVSLGARTRVMKWLDRRFFREAYDAERILIELIDDVQELESASGVSRLVSHALEAAFHPASLFIWYRDHDSPHLTLSYSSGGYVHRAELAPGSPLLRLIETRRTIVEAPLTDSDALPEADRQWLAEANVSYLVPVIGGGPDVLGVVMLGPKKSEEPYAKDDLKLLQAMARQIGLGRENLRLQARVDHDRQVRHDVLSRLDTGAFNLLKECPRCGRCYDMTASVCEDDSTELALSLPVERTLDGKYRLDRLIGKGGMGAVYEATDLRLARAVAVKILLGRQFGNQMALRRFEREAQACARLGHPNVVAVYDYGRVGPDGAYLVMELIRGETLRSALRARGRIPAQIAATWFGQICAGVAAAHTCGIVHRDLKPENVLIASETPNVQLLKVLDFGLAKLPSGGATELSSLTEPGVVMGTLSYMAPEQLTGAAVDHRTDIFAIGVMATEAITGSRPFAGGTHGELLYAVLKDRVELGAETPGMAELERVLRKATAREPQARYGSVLALGVELAAALRLVTSTAPAQDNSTMTG